jgi:hypothetical protein
MQKITTRFAKNQIFAKSGSELRLIAMPLSCQNGIFPWIATQKFTALYSRCSGPIFVINKKELSPLPVIPFARCRLIKIS